MTDFRNVKIFDGQGDRLSAPSNVRVRGNRIEKISTEPLPAEPGATVIEGGGRTLMPGLIDNHWHTIAGGRWTRWCAWIWLPIRNVTSK